MQDAAGAGFRLFDTATAYGNRAETGEGLRRFGREQCYLVSKVWHDKQAPDKLRADLEETLQEVNSSYLDAYLLHWPNSAEPIEGTLGALDGAKREGRVRHIGICNVTVHHLNRLFEVGIPIDWVQVEVNPLFVDRELLVLCQQNHIGVMGWAPLARGALAKDALLTEIGEAHDKSAAQVALRWCIDQGCMPIAKARKPEHIRANLDLNFTLSDEEMARLNAHPSQRSRERITPEYGFDFSDEFDFSPDQCWPCSS